jgi:hypothetical protein
MDRVPYNVPHTDATEAEPFRRVEVITGIARRRRWSEQDKAKIVAEAGLAPRAPAARLGGTSAQMQAGTAWADALTLREVAFHAVDLPPKGVIKQNSAEVTRAVDDMKRRFGVDRVHVVGHSKGGIDARDHARTHDDVDVLVMLGRRTSRSCRCHRPAGIAG